MQPATGRNTSVVEDNAQQRAVNLEAVGVVDEAHFLEFVHKQIHAGPRCTNHFRQCFLRYLRKYSLGLIVLAIARQQEQRASQPLSVELKS